MVDFNQTTDTSNKGRTIGNGVVIAYAVAVAAMTVLAVLGGLGGDLALGAFVALFLTLFAGDLWVQWADMNNYERTGVAGRLQQRGADDDAEADETDHESVASVEV